MAIKIYIDPGHGGIDDGAAYDGAKEDENNLTIALFLGHELRAAGFETRFSRETDKQVPLYQRGHEANLWKADAFISIHCDAWFDKNVIASISFLRPSSLNSGSFAAI